MEENICEWCSKEFEPKRNNYRRVPRFCSHDCRYAYNNAKKRLERIKWDMIENIKWIRDMIRKGGDLPYEAAQAMFVIDKNATIHQMDFSCKSCGQKRMDFPRVFDKCSFCGKQEWSIKLRVDE
jgi:alkyl hydroperoxide reductase subunit AhpC